MKYSEGASQFATKPDARSEDGAAGFAGRQVLTAKRLVMDARESGTSTGRHIDKLIEYLHRLEPDFEIIVLAKPHRLDFMKQIAPNFKVVSSAYKEFSLGEQIGLARQLRSLKPNLTHFMMTQQPVFYFRPVVTTIHDLTTARFTNPAKNWLVFKFKQLVYKFVVVWVAHKSRAIVSISNYVRRDIANFAHVPEQKITVTYLAADKIADKPEPVAGVVPGKFIVYVGRPQPHKNLKGLIAAYGKLRKTHPDLQLVLAGKKDVLYERLGKWAGKQGIKGVHITGFVSEGQLRWLYENCAVYAFPSYSEGFGLPALEAMAHGAPVASSNWTCLPEIYGPAAHYFDPSDTADMAKRISQVIDDAELRERLIAAGTKQAAKYSWAKMATQTLEIYKKYL